MMIFILSFADGTGTGRPGTAALPGGETRIAANAGPDQLDLALSTILELCDVNKTFGRGGEAVHALQDVSLKAATGELVAIMGASGSGKSTLLHLVGGLDVPDRGTILVEGSDLAAMSDRRRTLFRRDRLGIVFQAYNLLPTLTAEENIGLPLLVAGAAHEKIQAKTCELLEKLHLRNRASHRPAALSGGEQQRVAIARSLLNDPALILADEPTGNLDSRHSQEIWELLTRLAHEFGKAVLMVTHEAAAAAYADRVVVLKDGKIVGQFRNEDSRDASLVAARYQELAG
jgi:putative ABC transport system ATP-binding protein